MNKFETDYKVTWCPGCGNFAIKTALHQALTELNLNNEDVLIFYGIGCSGNGANFTKTYSWHSLHGRSIPSAIGAKLANKDLTIIVMAGDGDSFGEGMGHFIHGIRGNTDITYITHDNKVYGLTTGQTAPTSEKGFKTKSTPDGVIEVMTNPISLALSANCNFVSRGFTGDVKHLKELIKKAIKHKGFSLVDVFQPCVTFNKINTSKWYLDRLYNLDNTKYNKNNIEIAFKESLKWGNKIPYGIFYEKKNKNYGDKILEVNNSTKVRNINKLLQEFK